MKKYLLLISYIFLVSCSSSYLIKYDTYLKNSPDKSLHFEDKNFSFDFLPVPNGVYLKIINLTNETAYLVWDKSYFISPDGNTHKALNTDILEVEKEIAQKEKYESIIAPNAKFARFTTSVTNLSVFKSIKSTKRNFYFSFFSRLGLVSQTDNEINYQVYSFYKYGKYWPTKPGTSDQSFEEISQKSLRELSSFLMQNDRMGLGINIKINEKSFEYRFNFKLKEVRIYKTSSNGLVLLGKTKAYNLSKWEKVNK